MRQARPSRILTSLALVALAGAASAALDTGRGAGQKSVTLGPTFDIVEPDMREEIRARGPAAQQKFEHTAKSRPLDSYSGFQSVPLPLATRTATRSFDPTYTLPEDIFDANGQVLFAKGTQVNVYDRITMPGRFIVIGPHPSHYEWLKTVAKPGDADIVLLAGGNVAQVRRDQKLKVYLLDARGVERLGLQAIPSIVQQSGRMLKVAEYALDDAGKAREEEKPEKADAKSG